MRGSKADEGVVHDEEIVTMQVLFDGSFAKFAQAAAVPLDFNFGMLSFVVENASEQWGVAARMIPSESFESNSQTNLLVFRNHLRNRSSSRPLLGQQNVLAIKDDFVPLVQYFTSFHDATQTLPLRVFLLLLHGDTSP